MMFVLDFVVVFAVVSVFEYVCIGIDDLASIVGFVWGLAVVFAVMFVLDFVVVFAVVLVFCIGIGCLFDFRICGFLDSHAEVSSKQTAFFVEPECVCCMMQ